jgi:hypothetical protein
VSALCVGAVIFINLHWMVIVVKIKSLFEGVDYEIPEQEEIIIHPTVNLIVFEDDNHL